MAKFVKKPIVVEAEQWFPEKSVPGVTVVDGVATVVTAHGQTTRVEPGDWVIAEPDGRGHYPCKPDIFNTIYSAAATPGDSATPGMAWRDIAASAYRAYAASTGNKNFRGDPMPPFDELPDAIRTAWQAAVRQAGDCLKVKMDRKPPDESVWAGWLPP